MSPLIALLVIVVVPVAVLAFLFMGGRPDLTKYKAHANCDRGDKLWAYREAAKSLGVTIQVGYPVPCMAGARAAAGYGMVGIYILREHVDRENDLTMEMFNKLYSLSE